MSAVPASRVMTSRRSHRIYGDMPSKIVLSFSLLLGLCGLCLATADYAALKKQVEAAQSPVEEARLFREFRDQADDDMRQEITFATRTEQAYAKERPRLMGML